NRFLEVLEPSGYRWLNETHLKVDRGVEFYNKQPVPYDSLFWLNRAWLVVFGLGAVLLTQRSVAQSLRGVVAAKRALKDRDSRHEATGVAWGEAPEGVALANLGMKSGAPSFLHSVGSVAGTELRELLRQGGLYLFVPLILIQVLGSSLLAVGAFDTPVLLTPGTSAVAIAPQATTLILLLLLFYTVESLERERSTGLSQILYATPLRTGALLFGKALAALIYSGFRALTGQISWAGNWALWRSLRWSDLGFFETDRAALIWNRVMVLGLAVLFTAVAVRLFGRRGADAVRTMHRIAPR